TMQNIPLEETNLLPHSVVNYVSNLKEAVVMDNASADAEFAADDYIVRYRPKSVLCSPLVLLNKLYGIIYLENNVSVGAFTEERLKMLNLLSSQMAISIQNALLYASLEEKVEERTIELRREKKKSDDLLMNILPEEVADELKQNGFAEARQFDQTTVLFTDFINFTKISERLTAKELVAEVHQYFTAFDEIIERNRLEKIKTIGDAYLAVAGLPHESDDHACRAANAALEMADFVKCRKAEGALFDIRIGLNSGPVVAGIVGVKKFVYDIWGDTVNTASRMETNSEAGRINISASTYKLLRNHYHCTFRGSINAKNKGMVDMYFLEGRKKQIIENIPS
ncbi:MAG: GAF domain-containing protein, partial [Chitinophagaceae bacterium]|nr:GAF domain-containing protein [Chitinophagaceae bacterium]